MVKNEKADVSETYADSVVSLTPFALKKLGIVSNQTLLKVDTYNLVCIPYRLSMKGAVLLGSFSRDEIVFFQRFKGSLAGLNIVIQPGDSPAPRKIFCRCALVQFLPMKGRESVGLISVEFRPCPPDLQNLIGSYMMLMDRLRADYRELAGKTIPMNPDTAKILGFNNYATLSSGTVLTKLALFTLGADRLVFLAPMQAPDFQTGQNVNLRLFFQKYQFNVAGRITDAIRLPTGVQKGTVELEFSPELVDLLDTYYLEAKLGARVPKRPT
ncbi:MAG: hypothetical protein GX430_09175 [Treponema sp.]|nr:hypothetical protein [Treponema sp.]